MFDKKEVDIKDIIIHDRAREDVGDIEDLKSSIQRFGLFSPIIITPSNELIAGYRRLTACKELGLTTIPTMSTSEATKDDLLMIELMENTTRKDFEWHEELLLTKKLHTYWKDKAEKDGDTWGYRDSARELGCALGGFSTNMTLAEGLVIYPDLKSMHTKGQAREAYKKINEKLKTILAMTNISDDQKDRLTSLSSGIIPDEDKEKLSKVAARPLCVVKNEDIEPNYQHNQSPDCSKNEQEIVVAASDEESSKELPKSIYVVKSFEEFHKDVPDNSVGFCEMDPPYAIDFNHNYGKVSKIKSKETDWTIEQLYDFYTTNLPIIYNKLLDGSWILSWTGKEHWMKLNDIATNAGFATQPFGIWKKPGGSCNIPKKVMVSDYEIFLLFRKGQATFNTNSMSSIMEFTPPSGASRIHQWEKPMEMYDYIMNIFSKPGSIFLSPFAGSGNSMLSAIKADMMPMGCDINQTYIYNYYKKLEEMF